MFVKKCRLLFINLFVIIFPNVSMIYDKEKEAQKEKLIIRQANKNLQ